jgi:hypothetical protein
MKHIKTLVLAFVLTSVAAQAECKIFTSPATNFSTLKGSESISLSISQVYYEKNKKGKKKMKFKTGSEALLEFDRKAREYLQKECEKYKLSTIYNYQIRNMSDENWYNFYASYDYE